MAANDPVATLDSTGKYTKSDGLDIGSLLGNLLQQAIGSTATKDTTSTGSSTATGSTTQTGSNSQNSTGTSSNTSTGSNSSNMTGSSSQNTSGSNTQNTTGTNSTTSTGSNTQQQSGMTSNVGNTSQNQTSRTTGTISTTGGRSWSQSTQNSADIARLVEQYGKANAGITPEELAAIFNQGYKQAPNVMLAQSQALGARGGDNTAAAMGLNMLNKDLVDMAAQKKFQYAQLAGQLAGQIGDLTRSSTTSGSESSSQTWRACSRRIVPSAS